eukprot:COSAG01_NODE_8453_length_2781_cov_1.537286_3_plen_290_part_00
MSQIRALSKSEQMDVWWLSLYPPPSLSLSRALARWCVCVQMYAHQTGVQMVPLMLQEGYRANGWLGMLLGTRVRSYLLSCLRGAPYPCVANLCSASMQLWYGFFGAVVNDESKFNAKIDEMCRELSSRMSCSAHKSQSPPPASPPLHIHSAVAPPQRSTPVSSTLPVSTTRGGTDATRSSRPAFTGDPSSSSRPSFSPTMRMDTFDANTGVLANDQIALSPHPSEFFLVLSMQREREIADRAERAERAERERAAERESAAAERQLQMLVAVAMMTCASAVVCAVILRSK